MLGGGGGGGGVPSTLPAQFCVCFVNSLLDSVVDFMAGQFGFFILTPDLMCHVTSCDHVFTVLFDFLRGSPLL